MPKVQVPHAPHFVGWDTLSRSHLSVAQMFVLFALPLSLVPPAMIYYAGITYGGHMLPALSRGQLEVISVLFFLAELVMTFVVAFIIQWLTEWVGEKCAFADCYKLAVVAPIPLWLAPLFLFIPSFTINLTLASLALIASGMLVFYGVPSILRIEEEKVEGTTVLLAGSILAVGLVAWAAMMYLTLLSWSFITFNLLPLM